MADSTAKSRDRAEAVEALREIVKPGDTLITILRHVSRSGMLRGIDVYKLGLGDERAWLSRRATKAIGWTFSERRECVTARGADMDMGYALSSALFPDGFSCTGEDCPSNDHSNGMLERGPEIHHADGGYALRQRWM